ncbi:MAG: hypothetical protein V3575_06230 [Candidatus Absconditabacteria bacterium]
MNYQNIEVSELRCSLEKKSNGRINKEILSQIIEQRTFVIEEIDYTQDLLKLYGLENTCKELKIEDIHDVLWKKLFDTCMDEIINQAQNQLYEILLSNTTPGIINTVKISQPKAEFINDIEGNRLTLVETINEDNKTVYICKNSFNAISLVDTNGNILIKEGKYSNIKYINKTIICTKTNGNDITTNFFDINLNNIFLNLNNSLLEFKILLDNKNNQYLLLISSQNGKSAFSIFNTDGKLIFGNNHYSSIEKIIYLPNGKLILFGSKGDKYGIFDIEGNNIYGKIDGKEKYMYFENPITKEVYITSKSMETRDINGKEIFPVPPKYKGKKYEISYGQTCQNKLYLVFDKFMSINTFCIDIEGNTKPWLKKFEPTRKYLKLQKIN